jgi:[ribosomal protein S5]-alanine N-acetyltransferase
VSTAPNRLHTARLVLRPPSSDDVEDYFAFAGDPRYAFFAFDGELTRERIARFLERYIVGPPEVHAMFVIEHEGELVGSAQLDVDGPNRLASLGYGVSPARWGRGLATEAARAVVEHGFNSFGLDKIWA